jgi:hypothetical protein
MTRGQFSKVVVNSMAQIRALITPPTATFWDVPYGSTFYTHVETAYAHFAMKGDANGEFRVSQDIKRGEIAQTLMLATLLGNCCPNYQPPAFDHANAYPGW